MNVMFELSSSMEVAEEVSNNCDHSAGDLNWDMPSGADDLRGLSISRQHTSKTALPTPRTIPVGNIRPNAAICIRMCTQRIAS